MADILWNRDDFIFSYRVAGICIQEGKVLLQKPTNDSGFAFPGGHVAFGETNEETLKREFKEEIGADITIEGLKWVGEIFFTWGEKPCHQICLYYDVKIEDGVTPRDGMFFACEQLAGRTFQIEFHLVPLERIAELTLYPENARMLLQNLDNTVQHFVYQER